MKRLLLLLIGMCCGIASAQTVITSQDVIQFQQQPQPANPPAGTCYFFLNQTTGQLASINSAGANCGSSGGGGSPGGLNGQVQFNSSSSFGGITDFTTNGTTAVNVESGGTLTVKSGGTLTCASGSTCPTAPEVSTVGATGANICARYLSAASNGIIVNSEAETTGLACGATDIVSGTPGSGPTADTTWKLNGGTAISTDVGFDLDKKQKIIGGNEAGSSTGSGAGTIFYGSSLFPTGVTNGGGITASPVLNATTVLLTSTSPDALYIKTGTILTFGTDTTWYVVQPCPSSCAATNSNWYSLAASGTVTVTISPKIGTGQSGVAVLMRPPLFNFGYEALNPGTSYTSQGQLLQNISVNGNGSNTDNAGGIGLLDEVDGQENTRAQDTWIYNNAIGMALLYSIHSGPWENINISWTAANRCAAKMLGLWMAGATKKVDRITINALNCNTSGTPTSSWPFGVIYFSPSPTQTAATKWFGSQDLENWHVEGYGITDALFATAKNLDGTQGWLGSVIIGPGDSCASYGTCTNQLHIDASVAGHGTVYWHDGTCGNGTTNLIKDDINGNTLACQDNPSSSNGSGGFYYVDSAGGAFTNMNCQGSNSTFSNGVCFYNGQRLTYKGGVVVGGTDASGNETSQSLRLSELASPASGSATYDIFYGISSIHWPYFIPSGGSATAVVGESSIISANVLPKAAGTTGNQTASLVSDNGTTLSYTGTGGITASGYSPAASTSAVAVTGAPYTGGSGTTNFPATYLNAGASGPSTFSTAGTMFGENAPSGFTGNLMDFHINGGASVAKLDYQGNLTVAGENISGLTVSLPVCTDASKNFSSTCTGLITYADLATAGINGTDSKVQSGTGSFSASNMGCGDANGGLTPCTTTPTGMTLGNGVAATTQSAGDNSTKVATTAYTNTAYNLIEGSGCTTGSHCTLTGLSGFYWCNTSAECYWTLDAPVAGKQYCFGNYGAQTNVLSITSTTSVYIVYKGVLGTVTTGTLVSNGAAGDFTCMVGVDTTHYMVTGAGYGTWSNN